MLRTTRLPRPILLVAACLALSACASATPYQPAEKRDGFWDQKVEENRYLVTFRGNSATPRDIVETYLLFRAAEITLESGHDWFRIAEQDTGLDRRRQGLLEGELFSKKGKHAHRRHRHRRKFRRRGFVRFGFFGSPFFFGGVHRYSPAAAPLSRDGEYLGLQGREAER